MALEPIKLPKEFQNTLAECDAVLGVYMRSWDNLEMQSFTLFHTLVDANIVTSRILHNAIIDQRTMRNILRALGKQRLSGIDFQKLDRLLRRMKDASTIRNRLIHGKWQLNLELIDGTHEAKTAEWVRFYDPVDPDILQKIHGKRPNQKLLATHRFTLKQIIRRATDAKKLADDVKDFMNDVTLLPVPIPQPVF